MNYKKNIVSYVRVSQEDKDSNDDFSCSIHNQLALIKSYAKSIGLLIDKEYIDDGYSGTNFDRPGFLKLKDDIDNGTIEMVITKDISRLGRNFIETIYYISEYFVKNHVRYIAINDQYDSQNLDSNHQEAMVQIKSLINDRYVKDAAIKRKQIADLKTLDGQFIGAIAPYGYKIKKVANKRSLEIDDNVSFVIKRIFCEIANGKSRKEVAKGLNNDGILSPVVYKNMTLSKNRIYYQEWSDKIIYRIVKNRTYTGKIIKRKSLKKDYHQKKRSIISIADQEVIHNCHPKIINEELFDLANSKLKKQNRSKKGKFDSLFVNLVQCGECGKNMLICRKQNSYYFKCVKIYDRKLCFNRSISASKLQRIVTNLLNDLINNEEINEKIMSMALKKVLSKQRIDLQINNLKRNIELHDTNIKNLYLKKVMGQIDLEDFVSQKENENLLKNQAIALLKEVNKSKTLEYKKKELKEMYTKFKNDNNFVSIIVKKLIDKVVIYQDNTIEVSFRFRSI